MSDDNNHRAGWTRGAPDFPLTYDLRLAWPNKERKICQPDKGGCGQVHPYMTGEACKPALFPDHFKMDSNLGPELVELPPGVPAVLIGVVNKKDGSRVHV